MNATNNSSREIKNRIQRRLAEAKRLEQETIRRDREYEQEERQRIESEEDYWESRDIDPYGDDE